ncbi:MAG: hypothetical protein VCE43_10165 [Myxococcota bacterium]
MTDTVIQAVTQMVTNAARAVANNLRCYSIAPVLPMAAMLGALSSATVAGAVPLISEIHYDAVGADNGQTFVEIYGEPGSEVDGLLLEGVNGANGNLGPTIALTGIFGPEGIFVVADDVGDGTSIVLGADQIANFDFQNGPDSIVLRDADEILDAVGYGSFGLDEVFAGEGNPAPDAPAGSSLARVFADVDTDDNEADFELREFPSPGSAELLSMPEPRPIALLTLGLLALAKSRHRAGGSGSTPLDGVRWPPGPSGGDPKTPY